MAKGINIGGGWLKQSDKGDSISIRFNEASLKIDPTQHWVSLYPNGYKKKPNEPDYNLVATPKEARAAAAPKPPSSRPTGFPKPNNYTNLPLAPRYPKPEQNDLDRTLDGPPPDLWERFDSDEEQY